MRRTLSSGFTLIELLTGLAVMIISLSVGVPAMARMAAGNSQAAALNQFVAELRHARQQAVRLQQPVTVCPSASQAQCERWAAWHDGLIVFVDRNRNNRRDDGEALLRRIDADPALLDIAPASVARWNVRFQANGTAGGKNGTHRLCVDSALAAPKEVVISNTGRVRIQQANNTACL